MITANYAAVLALFFVALSVRTILVRRAAGVGLGDGDDLALMKAIRAHGNFAEYVPITLVLCLSLEITSKESTLLLHSCGASLLLGRLLHAIGVSRLSEDFRFRVTGMALTLTALVTAAAGILFKGI